MHHDIDRTALDELVGAFATEHHCPSIAWGIVRDGALAVTGATGSVEGSSPSSRTVYRIASMTKSFTAATVLALRDEGVLALEDAIAAHAPELEGIRLPTADAAPIRVRDLLSMSSGLATDDVWADRHLDLRDDELDAIVAAGLHFAVDPGTRFEYSNLGYALVGRIVERATGTRVQEHVRERFLGPLGMERTTWEQPAHDEWARPTRWDGEGWAPEVLAGDGVLAPMGGLWSSVEDVAVWSDWFDRAFPAGADGDASDRLLRRSSRREMQQMHRYAGARELLGRTGPHGYGFGLLMRDDPLLGMVAGHSGGLPGYGSNMRWLPGRRLGVVALANVTYAPMAELTLRILDALHTAGALSSETVPVTRDVERLAAALVALLNDWDDVRASELFTDNVALDDTYERRRAAVAEAVGQAGPVSITSITALSAAAADVHLADAEGGTLKIEMELAPLVPVRIESFSIER